MQTCSTPDLDKTAQFFFAQPSSQSPSKYQKSLQIICIDPYKKITNKMKRTSSQIELPKLQLNTDLESYEPIKTKGNNIMTPGGRLHIKSTECSPQKLSSQMSFNKQLPKSFLKSRPQQKLVTRIFGQM